MMSAATASPLKPSYFSRLRMMTFRAMAISLPPGRIARECAGKETAQPQPMVSLGPVAAPRDLSAGVKWRGLSATAKNRAIEELKRRGREAWGATYYSQMAPPELCRMAGRPREVQYGALIGWIKRMGKPNRPDPACAIDLVAYLLGVSTDDEALTTTVPSPRNRTASRRSAPLIEHPDEALAVSCPGVVHDHRFVVLGELPREELHAAVILQPQDGAGYWYPQVARHNPLRAGRAFSCFVRLGNPGGIWHTKKLPLDAKLRVLALYNEWKLDWSGRMAECELQERLGELGVAAQKECFVCRASIASLAPTLRDHGRFAESPLVFHEPRAEACVAPVTLAWHGGAAYMEIREGCGDRLLYEGTAAPGATLVLRGGKAPPPDASVIVELENPGQYRLRLYPAAWSFVDPPYEWWLHVT